MALRSVKNNYGFTLIELVMIILIIGILSAVAVTRMGPSLETARIEATRIQLEALSAAIVGNPEIYANGARADFGYVGDIGALPPDLDALAFNPGLSTWDGPYIRGVFQSGDFKRDAWDTDIAYNDTLLRSTGSGSDIDKVFAASSNMLLNNNVTGTIVDADRQAPGGIYKDSLIVNLVCPDGAGGLATASMTPDKSGLFEFASIPIGNQTLSVIYIPDNDTMSYGVTVLPGRDVRLDIAFPVDLW
jgi:prepilin-type N-terminal cleavage/methylation domain-containing protein